MVNFLLSCLAWGGLVSSIVYTFKLRFLQLSAWRYVYLFFAKKTNKISSFQAFSIGLSSRVGTGSLIGVALAIQTGGPGAVFWMWIMGFFGMCFSFAESSLSQFFKIKIDGFFRGSTAYILKYGLNSKVLAGVFSLTLFVTAALFNVFQARTIEESLKTTFALPKFYSALALTFLTLVVLLSNHKKIGQITEILMPAIVLAYLLISVYGIYMHSDRLMHAFYLIFSNAFNLKPISGGAIGYMITVGIRRGMFASEVGLGLNSISAGMADAKHPAEQGFVQMIGVFIDIFFVCTITALLILCVMPIEMIMDTQSISAFVLTQKAIQSFLGDWSLIYTTIMVFLFASTTMICNCLYCENGFYYLFKNRGFLFYMIVLLPVLGSFYFDTSTIVNITDLGMLTMSAINIFGIFSLFKIVKFLLQHYQMLEKKKQSIDFDLSKAPKDLVQSINVTENAWLNKKKPAVNRQTQKRKNVH